MIRQHEAPFGGRPSGRGWELKLEPPVNRVIPIAQDALAAVWAAFGEAG